MARYPLALAAVAATLFAVVLLFIGPKAQYVQDGYTYAIAMLMDRGVSMPQAEHQASAFFRTQQPAASDPEFLRYLNQRPEYWNLFRVRVVYSALAAVLYPWRGYEALIDISRIAYVLTACLSVLLIARFSSPVLGFIGSAVLSVLPAWQDLARDSLTDALAVFLVTATLYVTILYLSADKRPVWKHRLLLVLFAVVCGLLTFTRPITYVIDAALLTAAIFYRPLWKLLAISIGWTILVAVCAWAAKAPGLVWLINDTYRHFIATGYAGPGQRLWSWYAREEWNIAIRAFVRGALAIVPVVAIVGIVYGRKQTEIRILAGALIGTWIGAIVDPNRFDMIRCVVLPVGPAILAAASYAILRAKSLIKIGPSAHQMPRLESGSGHAAHLQ